MYRLFLCSDYVFTIYDINFMLNFITSALSVVMFTVLSDVISQLHLYFLRKKTGFEREFIWMTRVFKIIY